MAVAMRGLRVKPTYEDPIGVAISDELYHVKFPNRDAQFLRWLCPVTIRWRGSKSHGKTARNGK